MWYATYAEVLAQAAAGLPDGTPLGATDTGWTGYYDAINGLVSDLQVTFGLSLLMYGDGSDGAATFSTDDFLTRDMYYTDLTIDPGVGLYTSGYRIYVRGTLVNQGRINNDASQSNTGYLGEVFPGWNVLQGGASGGNGAHLAVASGSNGVSESVVGGGGDGGAGGDATGNPGGAAGTTQLASTSGGYRALPAVTTGFIGGGVGGSSLYIGGGAGGGGGGSNDAAASGGGGGGGGGVVVLVAREIDNTDGTIAAKGGHGADASGTGEAGGGGGGGGGLVLVCYDTMVFGTEAASGGVGGAGQSGGTDGADGAAGNVVLIANR